MARLNSTDPTKYRTGRDQEKGIRAGDRYHNFFKGWGKGSIAALIAAIILFVAGIGVLAAPLTYRSNGTVQDAQGKASGTFNRQAFGASFNFGGGLGAMIPGTPIYKKMKKEHPHQNYLQRIGSAEAALQKKYRRSSLRKDNNVKTAVEFKKKKAAYNSFVKSTGAEFANGNAFDTSDAGALNLGKLQFNPSKKMRKKYGLNHSEISSIQRQLNVDWGKERTKLRHGNKTQKGEANSDAFAQDWLMKHLPDSVKSALGSKALKHNKKLAAFLKSLENASSSGSSSSNHSDQGHAHNGGGGDAGSSSPTDLKGKIAQAIMWLFFDPKSGSGQWLASNGPGAIIFGITGGTGKYSGQAPITVVRRVANAWDNDILTIIYGDGAWSSSMVSVIDNYLPMLFALAGVLMVLALVWSTTKMGWGIIVGNPYYRTLWGRNILDILIAIFGVSLYPWIIHTFLYINGAIVIGIMSMMASRKGANGNSLFNEAMTLGFSKSTLSAMTGGTYLGSDFVGIIFCIIYLVTYLGLAVYLKYYYFVREISFTILAALGPAFIALWGFNWGKVRTVNWFREMIGVVFIQSIQALTLSFMASLMAWNDMNWAKAAKDTHVSGRLASFWQTGSYSVGQWFRGNLIGGAGNDIKAIAQLTGFWGGNTHTANLVSHFETMVIGFVIMILFQPLSKSLAGLFAINSNMLESIHDSTSKTLKTTGSLAVGAAASAALLGIAGAGGLVASGKSALDAGKAASAAKNAALAAGKPKSEAKKAAKRAFAKRWNDPSKTSNKLREAAMKANAELAGITGNLAGEAVGSAADAAGLSGITLGKIALTKAGGAVGRAGAKLLAKPLSKLGLKPADPNAEQKKQKKATAATEASKGAVKDTLKNKLDNDPGMGSLKDAVDALQSDPEFQHMSKAEQRAAIRNLKNARQVAQNGMLDNKAKAEVEAQKLMNGDGNIKNANKVYHALTNAMDKAIDQGSGSPEDKAAQKEQMHQAIAKSMALGGAPTNTEGTIVDNGVLDATTAAKQAKADFIEGKEREAYNANPHGAKSFEEFKAQNPGMADRIGSQYSDQISHAMDVAGNQAYANSNGRVIGKINLDNFSQGLSADDNAIVNSNTIGSALTQQMQKAGFSKPQIQSVVGAMNNVSGRSLLQPVDGFSTTNGESAQIIDSGLLSDLSQQMAQNINGQAYTTNPDAKPINASQLNGLYNSQGVNKVGALFGVPNSQGASPQDLVDWADNVDDNSAYAGEMQKWVDYRNLIGNAANLTDVTNPSNWGLGFSHLFPFSLGHKAQNIRDAQPATFATQGYGGNSGLSDAQVVAGDRIRRHMHSEPENTGVSMAQAYNMAPKLEGKNGKILGVRPGSARMVIQNTQSVFEVKDGNGQWYQSGEITTGDPSLRAGQEVIQDMTFNSAGQPVIATDPRTHLAAQPYSIINGAKQNVPLGSPLPKMSQFFPSDNLGDVGENRGYDYTGIPASDILSLSHNYHHREPSLDMYNSRGYHDYQVQGHGNTYAVTAIDPYGQRQVVTSPYTYSDFNGISDSASWEIPLQEYDGGLLLDNGQNYKLDMNDVDSSVMKEQSNKVLDSFFKTPSATDRFIQNLNNNILPLTQPDLSQWQLEHDPHTSVNNLDWYSKVI